MSDSLIEKASPVAALATAPKPERDWYIHEWMLLAFAAGMMLLIYFVAQHEADFGHAEIVRDAAVVEQSITRRLESDQQFLDRLALDVGAGRISSEEFDRIAGKRAIESGYITDVLRIEPMHLGDRLAQPFGGAIGIDVELAGNLPRGFDRLR